MNKKNVKKGLLPYALLLFVMLFVYYILTVGSFKVNDLTYNIKVEESNINYTGTIKEEEVEKNIFEKIYFYLDC